MADLAAHEVRPPLTNWPGISAAKAECEERRPHTPHFWTLSKSDGTFFARYYCEGRNG